MSALAQQLLVSAKRLGLYETSDTGVMEDELSQNKHKIHQSLTKVMLTMTALSTTPE